ncbi:MAG: hypothetical protein WD651_05335 [Acidimicrobiia bacterium]
MTEKDIVVTNQGSSAGALVTGIIAVLLIALAIWYFGFRPDNTQDGGVNVTIEVPTEPTSAP